jgi:hypothetical protein
MAATIQMGVTAGIFLASILIKGMRYLVYIRYLWSYLSAINLLQPKVKTTSYPGSFLYAPSWRKYPGWGLGLVT